MEAWIVSITPVRVPKSLKTNRFNVRLATRAEQMEIDVSIERLLDFRQCQMAVAEKTGYLLVKKEEWDETIRRAWQDPKQPWEPTGDVTEEDNDTFHGG